MHFPLEGWCLKVSHMTKMEEHEEHEEDILVEPAYLKHFDLQGRKSTAIARP